MDERTTPVVERVVDAVAAETERDPLDLPPLAAAVDPDALNALTTEDTRAVVSFPYAGQRVMVDAAGAVTVEPRTDSVASIGGATSDD
ncbi:HalOD1 output domain-containing protein [Halorubellus sp. PRR65]|uniref:HalOD1 output domain-containing protein n=1 Tax=Halorubellus sp. PRR65 TaxID=3098148 RepID=UPI002B25CC91|nr:HalOD1 output domain-containing protein [Halorubellus sp. PRR65]